MSWTKSLAVPINVFERRNWPVWLHGKRRLGTLAFVCGIAAFVGMKLYLDGPAATPFDSEVTEIFTTSGNGGKLLGTGWSAPERWGTWSEGPRAELGWKLAAPPIGDLRFAIRGLIYPPYAEANQTVQVSVNGTHVATLRTNSDGGIRGGEFTVPAKAAGVNDPMQIVFQVERPVSPAELHLGNDARKIGLGLKSITVGQKVWVKVIQQ